MYRQYMRFDPLKTTQAAAVVLRQHNGHASRLRLLKILVIADREALAETLEAITADQVCAMDHGPVPSRTYNMLRGISFDSATWNIFIAQDGPQEHRLISDPGVGKLSRYEIEKIQEVCDRFRNENDYALAHYTHTFAEWERHKPSKGSSKPIPLDDILEAIGLQDQANRIHQNIAESDEVDRLLGGAKEA